MLVSSCTVVDSSTSPVSSQPAALCAILTFLELPLATGHAPGRSRVHALFASQTRGSPLRCDNCAVLVQGVSNVDENVGISLSVGKSAMQVCFLQPEASGARAHRLTI